MNNAPGGETARHEGVERASVTSLPSDLRREKNFLLNRELSMVEFYRRVLEEALDATQPLLERLKFLSIFSSYIDEFFMIRVSALNEDRAPLSIDGMSSAEQLEKIRERLTPMIDEQMRCLREEILPQLRANGIIIAAHNSLTEAERKTLDDYFTTNVLPVLTPLAVDPAHPFPYISGLSLNIGLMVAPYAEHGITKSLTGKPEPRFVRIKVPPVVPRLIPVREGATEYVLLEDLIAGNVGTLFPRMRAGKCHLFRVTRDADIDMREDEAEDLLEMMQQTLRQRRFGRPVRLEVAADMPAEMVAYLTNALELSADKVYRIDGIFNVQDLMALYKLNRPELKDKPFTPIVPAFIKNSKSIFDVIKQQDVLLHHPYDSYTTVIDFIQKAAEDPDVLAIKMCLYRTGQHSPIPQALMEASERGKQVTALVELRARFDEEKNIEWAKRLEEAGVHVVYGLIGLKTHSKLMLVVRREANGLQSYAHIATGNYNPATASVYTDLCLFTTDKEIVADAAELFNYITGFTRQKKYRQLLVAPGNMRERMLALIERETQHARAGRKARIVVKINRLTDVQTIRALYAASQAGVSIDLIVRSVCLLRPGMAGVSENIRVRSIVGRFLEHSRIFYFANGGDEEIFIGSADWMPRNFDRRVEVVTPVLNRQLKRYLKEIVLAAYLRDNVKARELLSDGSYRRVQPTAGAESFNAQMCFIGEPKY
jgi:polyphosphate kinase